MCFWLFFFFWEGFFFFFSFEVDAVFAKISFSNHLLTKYLVEDNVTRGDKGWVNIQNIMYIQYFPSNTVNTVEK